jgi:hypothetical protein
MNESDELERQAVALIKQYGLFLPKPAKEFFKRLAVYLKWNQLEKTL